MPSAAAKPSAKPCATVFPADVLRRARQLPQRVRGPSSLQVPPHDAGRRAAHRQHRQSLRCSRATLSPSGRIILVDDITERVTLEAQLAQADKLSSIGLLAAGVAHEINTPLAVISSYAQMLSKQLRGRCAARASARKDHAAELPCRRDCQRPVELLAHLDHGIPRDQSEPGHSRHAVACSNTSSRPRRIDVELELASDLPPIQGNSGKLQQVFLNLLLNAKEAMPGGGRLRVATMVNGHVEALVSDSGFGHCARTPETHLRSVLHHQDNSQAGRQARHGTRPLRVLRHHPGTRGQDSCRERNWRRHNLPP